MILLGRLAQLGFFVLLSVCTAGFTGCTDEGIPEQKTSFVPRKMPDSIPWILSRKTPVQGKVVVLGGQVLRKTWTSHGCLFLIRALPLSENALPEAPVQKQVQSSNRNTFVVIASPLHVLGESRTLFPDTRQKSTADKAPGKPMIGPGNLVTVVGEVRGWTSFPQGDSHSRYLLLVSQYIERW